MKLGTHMPGGERRKPIDIEDHRTKSRSQLLKIEHKFDKNEMLDLNEAWYTHACW